MWCIMLKVTNEVQAFDTRHDAPRVLSVGSCYDINSTDPWVELKVDNFIYKVKADDLMCAIINSCNMGEP